ncbi:hypothetical protein FFLO_02172 [Filobasidium floriforme]|uniref:Prefoldin subunit 1 n=1 Tax=Filobasidium floriforme TaxID=5210 RepID=A0A8K0JPD9_9TREE|nr:Prefoldin [Filobasidium floriforme]KAG7562392.1 hypothetical protein FFLO_02172 [Filobasidium floriforme]KAH8088435.1 Prefoldin [Filobasidium floriforme]
MANLSDDTLHKILQQIQQQAVVSQRSLNQVNGQIAAKSREKRILELTTRQLDAIPAGDDVKMYKGVGKAFLMEPRKDIRAQQTEEDKTLTEDLANLSKKAKFLQKQVDDAQGQLKDIFHSQNRERDS